MSRNTQLIFSCTLVVVLFRTALGISCYQCVSTGQEDAFACTNIMGDDIQPKPCDHVDGAQFCIKRTGRFEASSIKCFQCSSLDSLACGEDMDSSTDLIDPISCDHVFEAEYCVKTTRIFGGGLGTKRFCSSRDLGNYCNYIRQPGDVLEYRSCVFTCSSDGCNPSTVVKALPMISLLLPAVLAYLIVTRPYFQ